MLRQHDDLEGHIKDITSNRIAVAATIDTAVHSAEARSGHPHTA